MVTVNGVPPRYTANVHNGRIVMTTCNLCNGAGRVQLLTHKTESVAFIDCPQCKPHTVAPAVEQAQPSTDGGILEEILTELKSINVGIWQIESNTDD